MSLVDLWVQHRTIQAQILVELCFWVSFIISSWDSILQTVSKLILNSAVFFLQHLMNTSLPAPFQFCPAAIVVFAVHQT